MSQKKLFIGSLSWNTRDEDLDQAFSRFGNIDDAVVIKDNITGRSRGFGFVTFSDGSHADQALEEMNGAELDGRNIVVNEAHEKREQRPRRDFLKKPEY